MTADEKLKELGWQKTKEDNSYIKYVSVNKWGIKQEIVFCLERQCIELTSSGTLEGFVRLKRSEIRAIYKKMVELCWEK